MFLFFILLLCFGTRLNKGNTQNIEKQIKKIEEITEKIKNIELFLNRATQNATINKTENEQVNKLVDFLKNNSLLLKNPNPEKKTYSFSELAFLLNERALINYLRKTATKKEEIEKILVAAFGPTAKKEITFFIEILFIKMKTIEEEEKKKKLAKAEKKQIAKIKESAQIKTEQERQERVNNLISELQAKKLLFQFPEQKKIYVFNQLLSLIDKHAVISYINKNQIPKETFEKMFLNAFGEQARLEVQSFVSDIFTRAEGEKKKISLAKAEKLQEESIDKNIKNTLEHSEESTNKLKNHLHEQAKKEDAALNARITQKKEKAEKIKKQKEYETRLASIQKTIEEKRVMIASYQKKLDEQTNTLKQENKNETIIKETFDRARELINMELKKLTAEIKIEKDKEEEIIILNKINEEKDTLKIKEIIELAIKQNEEKIQKINDTKKEKEKTNLEEINNRYRVLLSKK